MNTSEPFGEELSRESLRPLLDNQVLVVMGGGKGDEGKWWDAYAMSVHGNYQYIVGAVGWDNAGHTVHTDAGGKFVWHNLPGGALSGKPVFLGQGKLIHISGVEKEALQIQQITKNKPKILIASSAHVIIKSLHAALDKWIEQQRLGKIGTTNSGIGPAVATRWLRTGINFAQLLSLDDDGVTRMSRELVWPWSTDFAINLDDVIAEIKQEKVKLKELMQSGVVQIVGDDFAQNANKMWDRLLIEWAQSPSLGMFGGAYPNNTSNDTSFMGILSSLGIRPVPGRVAELLVVKAFPSAVGTHEFPERVSHVFPDLLTSEEAFAKESGEFGATTGRMRMVAFPSPWLVKQQLENNAPYTRWLSVRKLDMVPQFLRMVMENKKLIPVITEYDNSGRPIISKGVLDAQDLKWYYEKAILQALWGDKITLIGGFGPAPKDSRVIG